MVIPLLASTSKASDWACISTLPCAATAFSRSEQQKGSAYFGHGQSHSLSTYINAVSSNLIDLCISRDVNIF